MRKEKVYGSLRAPRLIPRYICMTLVCPHNWWPNLIIIRTEISRLTRLLLVDDSVLNQSGYQASILGHGVEAALLVTEQLIGRCKLFHSPSIQHHYPVVHIHNTQQRNE